MWAYDAAVDWCEENTGSTLNTYLRTVIVSLARQHVENLIIAARQEDLARYKKICSRMGMTAEQRLLNFMKNDLQRHS